MIIHRYMTDSNSFNSYVELYLYNNDFTPTYIFLLFTFVIGMDKKNKRTSASALKIPVVNVEVDENNPSNGVRPPNDISSKKQRRAFSGATRNTPLSDITNGTQTTYLYLHLPIPVVNINFIYYIGTIFYISHCNFDICQFQATMLL